MKYDFHVHSTYSDGSPMASMVEAAHDAGLDGVGFADHCNVSADEPGSTLPYDFDETYGERRDEIRSLRERYDVEIFDAIEMDYRPGDEKRIRAFLDDADFDYTIGSVHHVGHLEVMSPGMFADASTAELQGFVDRYFDLVIDLIDSELFDVAGHVDVTERNPHLRDYATETQYRAVSDAFTESRSVPELNAGRVFSGYRNVHPHPEFLDVLQADDVSFVASTDSHAPDEIEGRADYLATIIERRGIRTIEYPSDGRSSVLSR